MSTGISYAFQNSRFSAKSGVMREMRIAEALLILAITSGACAELNKILKHAEDYGVNTETAKNVLTNEEIITGLKEALSKGVCFALSSLNVKDRYFGNQELKILLPKEAKPIYGNYRKFQSSAVFWMMLCYQ